MSSQDQTPSFQDKLRAGTPTLSFEFYPPKDADGWGTLYSALGNISRRAPDLVTVTYGAGGSTRQKTVDLVSRIQDELGIETMAHLTCVGHSQGELSDILDSLHNAGVRAIMALRGDPPRGESKFAVHPDGFAHASDLIAFIKGNWDFCIGCSFYPEKHLEAETLAHDISYLKLKQDHGADFAVSQIFFDNAAFTDFRAQASGAGVQIPLIAGILPVTSRDQLGETGICRRAGTMVPTALLDYLGTGPKNEIIERGIEYAAVQCEELLTQNVAGIHFYTLNRSQSSLKVTEKLRAQGYFPLTGAGKSIK